jgi:hypothetical protein
MNIKGKIFDKAKKYFEEYLFGFDQNQLQMKLLTGSIDLINVNIRPDKINEIFDKGHVPFALKAGIISKLSVKVITPSIDYVIDESHKLVLRFIEDHS